MYGAFVGQKEGLLAHVYIIEAEYEGENLLLRRYLENLRRPQGLTDEEYRKLRWKAKGLFIKDRLLFKWRIRQRAPPQRVVGLRDQQLDYQGATRGNWTPRAERLI